MLKLPSMKNEFSNKEPGRLTINKTTYITRLSDKFRNRKPSEAADPKLIRSFIPGVILEILVKEGQEVLKGDDLLILDSMKMKNRIRSGCAGIIEAVEVKTGDKVAKGALLIRMK
jgi:biotin carboxyl carrier protein